MRFNGYTRTHFQAQTYTRTRVETSAHYIPFVAFERAVHQQDWCGGSVKTSKGGNVNKVGCVGKMKRVSDPPCSVLCWHRIVLARSAALARLASSPVLARSKWLAISAVSALSAWLVWPAEKEPLMSTTNRLARCATSAGVGSNGSVCRLGKVSKDCSSDRVCRVGKVGRVNNVNKVGRDGKIRMKCS